VFTYPLEQCSHLQISHTIPLKFYEVVILSVPMDIVDISIHSPVDQFKQIFSTDFRTCIPDLDIWVIEISMLSVRLRTPASALHRRETAFSVMFGPFF
jgi:hypothetical protein